MLTAAQLARCTGASIKQATLWLPHIIAAIDKYGIRYRVERAAFLAQIGVESGGLERVEEGLTYTTPERLQAVWPTRFKTREAALPYVRNPKALADLVYGGRMGNTQPGDGYRYRGRGLKQLTGRSNYAAYAAASGVDVVSNPDLLLHPKYAADSAAWFWSVNGCAALAADQDWKGLTRRINGGLTGYALRLELTKVAMLTLV